MDAVRLLRSRGVVVGIGRTEATLAECAKAVAAGATFVAHLFNHMPSFHHRDPGRDLGLDAGDILRTIVNKSIPMMEKLGLLEDKLLTLDEAQVVAFAQSCRGRKNTKRDAVANAL